MRPSELDGAKSPFYTDRERAALQWAEAVTLIMNVQVPDEAYEDVHKHFKSRDFTVW
jgi:alkylhydroperoxidase family enzyme